MKRKGHSEIIAIGKERWRLDFLPSGELMLWYSLPLEESEWRNNPIWFSWDDDDPANQEEWVMIYDGRHKRLPLFQLKRKIIDCIYHQIRRMKWKNFHFEAFYDKLGFVYHYIGPEIVKRLGSEWNFQMINDRYFYFDKINESLL